VSIPRGREIDGTLPYMNYADMEAYMAEFMDDWKYYGVTIMCDSWTGEYLYTFVGLYFVVLSILKQLILCT